jgi:hypothetical protein
MFQHLMTILQYKDHVYQEISVLGLLDYRHSIRSESKYVLDMAAYQRWEVGL